MEATQGTTAPRAPPRLPSIEDDPAWTLARRDTPLLERVNESLLTLADGFVGTRGSVDITRPGSSPAVFVSGVYTSREMPVLLQGPQWAVLDLVAADSLRCVLDMRTGALSTEQSGAGGTVRSFRFVSIARPGCTVLLAEGPPDMVDAGDALRAPWAQPGVTVRTDYDGGLTCMTVTGSTGDAIVVAASQRTIDSVGDPPARIIERIAAYAASTSDPERDRADPSAVAAVSATA